MIVWITHAKVGHRQVPKNKKPNQKWLGFLHCAPGRAHSFGGVSPLLARQGEELAERQGCRGRLRIWRKLKAKRWPDEQEADMRRYGGARRPISSKPETCTERCGVNPTGISVKVSAQYP